MRKILALSLSFVLCVSILGGVVGFGAAGNHSNAGPPSEIKTWISTSPVNEAQMNGEAPVVLMDGDDSLIRVDEEYEEDVEIDISQETVDNETELQLDITIPSELDATNVTFYIQTDAIEEQSGEIDTLDLFLNNDEHSWYVDTDAGPGESPWVLFEVPEFSTNELKFVESDSDDSGPDGEFTSPENDTNIPDNLDGFLDTEPLQAGDVEDDILAGNVRISSEHSDSLTTVSLNEDEVNETTLTFGSDLNESMTVYIHKQSLQASANVSDVDVLIDGEPVASGITEQGGNEWVAFEIDHFSERDVTVKSTGGGFVNSIMSTEGILIFLGGALLILGAGGYIYTRESRSEMYID